MSPAPASRQARASSEARATAGLDLPALRTEWRRRWGEPPAFRSRDLLLRAAAYRIQADASGDLPAPVRRRVLELAERFAADRGFTPVPSLSLKPGSSLVREWGGTRHEVAVTADGFTYQGESFRSLSQVAGKITGAKWSGPVFFGLKSRPGKAR